MCNVLLQVRSYIVDGENVTDIFSTDLTLAEIKTLRAKATNSFRPATFDGVFEVITLEEHIQIALVSELMELLCMETAAQVIMQGMRSEACK